MSDEKILDISKSGDENFKRICDAIGLALKDAINCFLTVSVAENADEFFKFLKYDHNSLYTTAVYSLLNLLSITYSDGITQQKIPEYMPNIDTGEFHDQEMNHKRVKRIKKEYFKRNPEHLEYLNATNYVPKTSATNSLWYALLSEFPVLKRFLHKEEAIIAKTFFEELNSAYDWINTHSGYDRFFLTYKLEMSSKLEMFYKILALIKKEKRRLKLSDSRVQEMISGMHQLHVVPLNQIGLYFLSRGCEFTDMFNEILGCLPWERTINCIVFNTDNIVSCYIKEPAVAMDVINILNFILNTVVFHLCEKIENELSISEKKVGFEFIKDIQNSSTSSAFFDAYLDTHTIINTNKNCSHDITFTHFKKLYKLKPEKNSC